ncbi:hypothetical protein CPB86DRAFT_97052 [Serendipita vermifera]|nr:hypothetical protein CPB86DRAFT_97052 [Serendipita vermifera]
MTSRPESHLHWCLKEHSPKRLSLHSDEEANLKDIEHYMKQRIKDDVVAKSERVRLIERAGGLFIWAKTVCDLLEDFVGDNKAFIRRVLSQKLGQMDPIYRLALEQAIGNDNTEETIDAYMKVLGVIVAAYEPVVNKLQSVLECTGKGGVIRFLHPTFREFLLNRDVCGRYHVDIDTAHDLSAEGCLSVMRGELEYDLCKIYDGLQQYFRPQKLEKKWSTLSSALRYSCRFWASHIIAQYGVIPSPLVSRIEDFFGSNLLNWIYMVAVQGSIDNAVIMLRKLSSLISTERIVQWSQDASRFLKLHWTTIRENPIKVYHEFIFAPQSSIFYKIYSKMDSFPHPAVRMGLDVDWPSGITVQAYEIRDRLPVYSIWDVETADGQTFVHPCRTYLCSLYHLSFDQQGDKMVLRTGCECGKLCRWDISLSPPHLLDERRSTSDGRHHWWANDGSKTVGLKDDQAYHLCISDSPSIHLGISDSDANYEWQFSPDHGEKLLHINNQLMTVWECSSGHQLFQMSYEDIDPSAMFSPDGMVIVCTLEDRVELICAKNGTVLCSWDDIILDSWNRSRITFFPKGDKFIIWGREWIYLFDGENWRKRKKNHDSLSISPDGQKIAIISEIGVRIFNFTFQEKMEYCQFDLDRMSFHYWLWSRSTVVSIKRSPGNLLFHRLPHQLQSNLSTPPIPPVYTLSLSPDSRHLITIHKAKQVHLWDVRSGHEIEFLSDIPLGLLRDGDIQYAPDSSCALLWNESQLMVLRITARLAQFIPFPVNDSGTTDTSQSILELLSVAFFPDSGRILIVGSDGKMTTLSLSNMAYNSVSSLLPPLNKRHWVACTRNRPRYPSDSIISYGDRSWILSRRESCIYDREYYGKVDGLSC